ncbi:hypothetical protein AB0C27_00695 [Nonomuraea sp. NPDC048882]|uniref:hypothetical protein n=1 Tax=Nonomuraea sp. NPDC048882 TaxID=3154347 RepID=UPI0033D83074
MTYPPPQHPQDPRASQGSTDGGPQPGPAAPWPGHGPRSAGQSPGRPGNGPQPRQGGPPPDFGTPRLPGPPGPYEQPDQYGRSGRHGQAGSYEREDPYGRRGQAGSYDPGDQYGRSGRHGQAGPYEPQDRYGRPAQHGQPDSYGHGDAYGRGDAYGQATQYGQADLYGLPQHDYGTAPRRGNTLVIGLSIGLGLILLAGGTVGAVTYLGSPETPAALPSSATSFPTTAPWQSDAPSDGSGDAAGEAADGEPSGGPADEASAGASGEPSGEPSGEQSEPATDPTATPPASGRAQPGSPIAHTEFGDWKFNVTGIRFSAAKVAGWTYDSCDPVDGRGVLAKNKCTRAVQVAYTAYRGHLKAVQVMMMFPTDEAAKAAATRLAKLSSNAVNIRSDMTFSTFAYGAIRTNPTKKYVVVTIVTADKTAKARAEKFHLYMQADSMSYFLLRDVTVTS